MKKETEKKLRQEQLKEEELKDQLEKHLVEEKEKGDYIRREAERLLREEKLLDRKYSQAPTVITRFRTEVIVQEPRRNLNKQRHLATSAPDLRSEKPDLKEVQTETLESYPQDMDTSQAESSLRDQRRKKMVYDPETGCYVRKATEDTPGETDGAKKAEHRLKLRADKKKEPSRVAEAAWDSSSKVDKSSEKTTVPMQTAELSATVSSKDSAERRRKDLDRQRAQFFMRSGDAPKSSNATSRARPKSEPNLEGKLKEMEQRRARLYLLGKSGDEAKSTAPTQEAADDADANKTETSPKSGGAPTSPTEDSRRTKKRTREERNKRRIDAEGISMRRSSSGDVPSPRVRKTSQKETASDKDVPSRKTSKPDPSSEAGAPTPKPRKNAPIETASESNAPSSSSSKRPSEKPEKKAVKVEYVWNGKEVTRVEVPIGTSMKEAEEELKKVGQPIKGYLKKNSDDDKQPDEESVEVDAPSQEKSTNRSEIRVELLNLDTAKDTVEVDGRAGVDKSEESPTTIIQTVHDEPEARRGQIVEKSAEGSNVDLLTFNQPGDSADGPDGPSAQTQSLDDIFGDTLGEFRKRADSTEGETFPHHDKLIQIETPIEVTSSIKIESSPSGRVCSFCALFLPFLLSFLSSLSFSLSLSLSLSLPPSLSFFLSLLFA